MKIKSQNKKQHLNNFESIKKDKNSSKKYKNDKELTFVKVEVVLNSNFLIYLKFDKYYKYLNEDMSKKNKKININYYL